MCSTDIHKKEYEVIQSMFGKLVPVLEPNIKSVADGCFGHRLISKEMYDSMLQLTKQKLTCQRDVTQTITLEDGAWDKFLKYWLM